MKIINRLRSKIFLPQFLNFLQFFKYKLSFFLCCFTNWVHTSQNIIKMISKELIPKPDNYVWQVESGYHASQYY